MSHLLNIFLAWHFRKNIFKYWYFTMTFNYKGEEGVLGEWCGQYGTPSDNIENREVNLPDCCLKSLKRFYCISNEIALKCVNFFPWSSSRQRWISMFILKHLFFSKYKVRRIFIGFSKLFTKRYKNWKSCELYWKFFSTEIKHFENDPERSSYFRKTSFVPLMKWSIGRRTNCHWVLFCFGSS